MCGDADGWGFPDDAIGGLLACCATSLLDYNLWIMSLFTQRGEKTDFTSTPCDTVE